MSQLQQVSLNMLFQCGLTRLESCVDVMTMDPVKHAQLYLPFLQIFLTGEKKATVVNKPSSFSADGVSMWSLLKCQPNVYLCFDVTFG